MAEITLGASEGKYLVEGLDDWVGLWRFACEARDAHPDAGVEVVREEAMKVVRTLIFGGYMRPGRLTKEKPGFEAWTLSPAAAVERIEGEWNALGRDPNISEVCWFENTERGDVLAKRLLGQR